MNQLPAAELDRLRSALRSARHTSGSTHNFYLYPARFSPDIARAVVEGFSAVDDFVLDPFMGGGTAIIECLAAGRSVIGIDLNALAHFVASVRTRPLSLNDECIVRDWATKAARSGQYGSVRQLPRVRNFPLTVLAFMVGALEEVEKLPFARQRAFARSVLLRLGQWAVDCRDDRFSRRALAEKLPDLTDHMLAGLRGFVDSCETAGLKKSEIAARRLLLCRTAEGLHEDARLKRLAPKPRLVFTSPPYPCVHVLYHRWQIRGRKETPAPYWIAQVPDGYDQSYYTGGSRTPTGERNYFAMIKSVFSSVRRIIDPDGLVIQLVGFADVERQLPSYLATMAAAGFETWTPSRLSQEDLWRKVPNRKWHAKLQGAADASSEILLFHRPRRRVLA